MSKKILVIGLDGVEPSLVMRWEDDLPTIKKLRGSGAWGLLKSTIPPVTAPAWCSFYTGKNPAKTGIYDFRQMMPSRFEEKLINRTFIKSETLWEILSSNGKRSILMNLPVTYPPQKFNGIMVTGMNTPPYREYCYPAHIAQEINEVSDGYIIEPARPQEEALVLRNVFICAKKRTEAMIYLLKEYRWDLGIICYVALDRIQHRSSLWKFINSIDPQVNVIKRTYMLVDNCLGKLLKEINGSDIIIVMGDHGFKTRQGWFFVNNWLEKQGYLRVKEKGVSWKAFLARHNLTALSLWLFPGKFKSQIQSFFRSFDRSMIFRRFIEKVIPLKRGVFEIGIDWQNTKAYSIGTHIAGIYINLKGRGLKGIIKKKKEYENLREEIIHKLEKLTDLEGNKVIQGIYKKEEVYEGPNINDAPDIILSAEGEWRPTATFGDDVLISAPWEAGEAFHGRNSLWIMHGKSVRVVEKGKDIDIVDLAPTILYLLDIPIPTDMDGKVMRFCIDMEYESRYTQPKEVQRKISTISKEERKELKRRLKELGYL